MGPRRRGDDNKKLLHHSVHDSNAFIFSWLMCLTSWSTSPASGIGILACWASSSATSMSFSAHLPVLLPQRESDQLAPLPWASASTRRGMSTPSFLANESDSKFATMQAHSSMLLMVLVICPEPTPPT